MFNTEDRNAGAVKKLLPSTPLLMGLCGYTSSIYFQTQREKQDSAKSWLREKKNILFEHHSYYQRTKNLISLPYLAICLYKMCGIFITLKAESDVTEVD